MKEIMFAGIGGQGVILSANIVARAAVKKGYYAAQSQAYGSESRGTSTRAEVVVSDGFVEFPHVEHADIFVSMAEIGISMFASKAASDGLIITDSSVFEMKEKIGGKQIEIPATRMSIEAFGKPLFANIIVLGLLTANCDFLDIGTVEDILRETVPPKALEQNLKALRAGYAYKIS